MSNRKASRNREIISKFAIYNYIFIFHMLTIFVFDLAAKIWLLVAKKQKDFQIRYCLKLIIKCELTIKLTHENKTLMLKMPSFSNSSKNSKNSVRCAPPNLNIQKSTSHNFHSPQYPIKNVHPFPKTFIVNVRVLYTCTQIGYPK